MNSLLSSLVSAVTSLLMIAAIPFFQGGIVAMSTEALDGHTSLDTFVAVGKSKYISLLVAYLALLAANLVVAIFTIVPLIIVGTVLLGGFALGGAGLLVLAVVGVIVAIVALAYLLILFFLQFYGHAIVLDDLGRSTVSNEARDGFATVC